MSEISGGSLQSPDFFREDVDVLLSEILFEA